jgi:hypothetical protein
VQHVHDVRLEDVERDAIGGPCLGEELENLIARLLLILEAGVEPIEQDHADAAAGTAVETIAELVGSQRREIGGCDSIGFDREHLDRLLLAVLEQREIGRGQVADGLAVPVVDDDADLNEASGRPKCRRLLGGEDHRRPSGETDRQRRKDAHVPHGRKEYRWVGGSIRQYDRVKVLPLERIIASKRSTNRPKDTRGTLVVRAMLFLHRHAGVQFFEPVENDGHAWQRLARQPIANLRRPPDHQKRPAVQ